jgi:hypothetical protein
MQRWQCAWLLWKQQCFGSSRALEFAVLELASVWKPLPFEFASLWKPLRFKARCSIRSCFALKTTAPGSHLAWTHIEVGS